LIVVGSHNNYQLLTRIEANMPVKDGYGFHEHFVATNRTLGAIFFQSSVDLEEFVRRRVGKEGKEAVSGRQNAASEQSEGGGKPDRGSNHVRTEGD
jgi:hypothetical protein